jgi:hypothetical protein
MEKDRRVLAIASLILGLFSLGAWLLPICGIPLSIIGLVLGIVGRGSSRRKMAIAGIVMGCFGLVLGIANGVIGAYLGVTGQLFPTGFAAVPSEVEQDIVAKELNAFGEDHPGAIVQAYSIEVVGRGEVLPQDAVDGVGSLYCYQIRIDYVQDQTCETYAWRHGLVAQMHMDGQWDFDRYASVGFDVWAEHACGDFALSPPPGSCK